MTVFVKLILEASFTAGLAALAVLLIRLAMKKAPKRWAYALWAVVFFRCLCPFSAESAVSLFNVIPDRSPETLETSETSAIVSEINNRPAVMERVETEFQNYGYTPYPVPVSAEPVREATAPVKKPVNKYAVIFAVWAAGASVMALYGVISYILLMRKLKTAVKTEEGVYESDLISTAFSAGFFPPKIYVPCGLFEEERKLIIAHERVHIRRLDYIVKPVAFIALSVHWFNPIIWLAFALMTRDMELSCDEAVLKIFGAGEKKAYSEALLHVSMKRSGLADSYKFMPLAFAETGIKSRVKNVLKYKKPTVAVTVIAAAVVIAACAALGTNAKSKAEDTDEEIKYVLLQIGVNNSLLDADGEEIVLSNGYSSVPANQKTRIIEGKRSADSVTFTIDEDIENSLIMDIDITELKINALEIYKEDGRSFLKAEFNIVTEEDPAIFMRDDLIRLDTDKEVKLFFVEGGGKKGVSVRAEYELEEDGSNGYSFMLYGSEYIPVYVNADLVKPDDTAYTPIAAGETSYTLDSGENVRVDCDPDMDVTIADIVQKITFNAEPDEGSKHRSVLIGMRAKNNMLDRQLGADFTGEEIIGLAIDDISVAEDKFTVRFKVTFAEGGGGIFIDENEPNSPLRLVRGRNENEYYLYMTADYDRENVDEYAIDLCGFDSITPQINSRFSIAEEKPAEYTALLGGWVEFALETGETGYAAYDVNDIPINNIDSWSFSTWGIEGKGVSIGCFEIMDEGCGSADFRSVLDFGDHPITSISVENMYTEKVGPTVKLYTEIKVSSPEGDGLMNSMSVNSGEIEMGVAKLINDEYLFTIIKEYSFTDDFVHGFAVVASGFETPIWSNTDYEARLYVNSALDPHTPQITTYDAYEQIYGDEDLHASYFTIGNPSEEEKARAEEVLLKNWLKEVEKQRQEEEQRKLDEEKNKASYPALQYPVSAPISENYSSRDEANGLHKGVDFAVPEGTPVYAAGKGTVLNADDDSNGYGICVIIDHGGDLATLYAHLSKALVNEGDEIGAGDLIGYSGKTGNVYGAHLHFEVRVNGAHTDPVNYLAPTEKAVLARYSGNTASLITLNMDGTFSVINYLSSYIPLERPEKEYKFENGILSLEFTNGSVICFEAVGNDLVYRKDLSNYIYSIDIPPFGSNDTFELIEGTSLNGGRIEMETMTLNGETYYLVSNETQLRAIGGSVYGLDKNYIQQCDIELSPDEWKPVGTRRNPFTGSYNGSGFEIKGLTMVDPNTPLIGMFGCAENANIYNITLRDYDIEKAGSKAKQKTVAPIVAINYGSRVYDNNVYPKEEFNFIFN